MKKIKKTDLLSTIILLQILNLLILLILFILFALLVRRLDFIQDVQILTNHLY